VFDLDGVLTDTATVHAAAWKRLFDDFLRTRADEVPFEEFTEQDYLEYVDGKPRYDGVASFLGSRGIDLPYGEPTDPPEAETVCGLGNSKDALFHEALRTEGFGGRECPYLLEHQGSVVWHGIHGVGTIVTAEIPTGGPVPFLGGTPEAASGRTHVHSDTRRESRRWYPGDARERYVARVGEQPALGVDQIDLSGDLRPFSLDLV
jgi:hypothetical protein